MKTFGRIVLVVAVVVALGSGLYLAGKTLFGGWSGSPEPAAEMAVEEQLSAFARALDAQEAAAKTVRTAVGNKIPSGADKLAFEGAMADLREARDDQRVSIGFLRQLLAAQKAERAQLEKDKADLEAFRKFRDAFR